MSQNIGKTVDWYKTSLFNFDLGFSLTSNQRSRATQKNPNVCWKEQIMLY